MVEKDYVLGWVLWAVSRVPGLVFKGGTALSKVYFPQTWRLSEDLDFVADSERAWEQAAQRVPQALPCAEKECGIRLRVKGRHQNPQYLQFKLQYTGPLSKNWVKLDITSEAPVMPPLAKPPLRAYSDYPEFRVPVETLEEILAQKLRALVMRKKVRDYYDVWRMTALDFDRRVVARLFPGKLEVKGLQWRGLADVFPPDLADVLSGYWERELGRLVRPVPDMNKVLAELGGRLAWLPRATR
jgi:predicted nucleotidyltransferase component of viral defense system